MRQRCVWGRLPLRTSSSTTTMSDLNLGCWTVEMRIQFHRDGFFQTAWILALGRMEEDRRRHPRKSSLLIYLERSKSCYADGVSTGIKAWNAVNAVKASSKVQGCDLSSQRTSRFCDRFVKWDEGPLCNGNRASRCDLFVNGEILRANGRSASAGATK